MTFSINKKIAVVFTVSILLFVVFLIALWNINFWPTDAKVLYFPALERIPHVKYISDIHDTTNYKVNPWLHGKEIYLLTVSFFQRMMKDLVTLRPLILVGLASVCLSSILLFFIIRKFLDENIAFICWMIFVTSFWPYVYVLFCKHQTLGMFLFLLSVALLNFVNVKKIGKLFYFLSGAGMLACVFASTVSAMYLPYYFIIFLMLQYYSMGNKKTFGIFLANSFINGMLVLAGGMCVFVYIHFPDIIFHVKGYFSYVNISATSNHFYYNQPVLQQWILKNIPQTHGGFLWVFRYFSLIMPVLFYVYLSSIIYLLFKCYQNKHDKRFIIHTAIVIAAGLSSPVLITLRRVAQMGGNYFTSFVGVVFLVGYALFVLNKHDLNKMTDKAKKTVVAVLALVFFLHIIVNCIVFFGDILPSRMGTTYLSNKIKDMGISTLYTYRKHPYRQSIVEELNPPLRKKLNIIDIDSISQVKSGYILMPPITKDSIIYAVHTDYLKFDDDIFLNELLKKGNLDDYTVASFKTLASSRIWYQEEEITSYKDLVLGLYPKDNEEMGRVRILDANKLRRDFTGNIPNKDYINLEKNSIRNIGNSDRIYTFKGNMGVSKGSRKFNKYIARIYKVGNPKDGLKLYIYKFGKLETNYVKVPNGENNYSKEYPAERITSNPDGGPVVFEFKEPIYQTPGPYFIKIYRTGKPDDTNYYRIYTKYQQIIN